MQNIFVTMKICVHEINNVKKCLMNLTEPRSSQNNESYLLSKMNNSLGGLVGSQEYFCDMPLLATAIQQ